jgi:RNase P subunit RPR2
METEMRIHLLTIASLYASAPALAQTSPDPLPANYIRVTAPMAQRLTLRIRESHRSSPCRTARGFSCLVRPTLTDGRVD